ncbi:MAG: DUF932 domain-containing protein [Candidatus Hodarchaeales archaeon]
MSTITLPAPKKVLQDQDLIALLDEHDLNFKVKKCLTPSPFGKATGRAFTSYRTDTEHIFAQGLTKIWQPIQNFDAFKCLIDLSKETDIKLDNVLSFRNGGEVCAQINVGKMKVGNKKDYVTQYLTIMNSHDGTRSMIMYLTPQRITCMNMISSVMADVRKRDLKAKKKGGRAIMAIRHSSNAQDRLDDLITGVTIAHGKFKQSNELYNEMAATPISNTYVRDVVEQLFPLEDDAKKRKKANHVAKLQDVMHRYESADNGLIEKDTAWNLYNSIQGHMQHYPNQSDSHFKSVLFGSLATAADHAMVTVLESTNNNALSKDLKSEIDGLTN